MTRHIFGPVPSRRLGISLGVDIVPFKTCTLDCIYCECGKTTRLTMERSSFIEPGAILTELEKVLSQNSYLEYITFSGSGEPTLNQDIGYIIKEIKKMSPVPVAVLTNGTLLYMPAVRESLLPVDLVLPSLDAVSPEVFAEINRPHPGLEVTTIIKGLKEFSLEYQGQIWLEILLVKGLNDSEEELAKLHDTILDIQPTKVQLNSLDRPPAYPGVEPVNRGKLEDIVEKWNDLPVEIVKRVKMRKEIAAFSRNLENSILNTISRRPLMIEDLEKLTGRTRCEIFKYIDILEKEKK